MWIRKRGMHSFIYSSTPLTAGAGADFAQQHVQGAEEDVADDDPLHLRVGVHLFLRAVLSLRDGRAEEGGEDRGQEVQEPALGSERVGRVREEHAEQRVVLQRELRMCGYDDIG